MRFISRKWRLLAASSGTLWFLGCTTDLAAREFFSSTAVRVFWQTLASALQAGVVDAVGG